MGYAVRVDAGQLAASATELAGVGEDLARAGEALARTLRVVVGASPGAALATAAEEAARRWQAGLHEIAEHGADLAAQTAAAAEAYRDVEALTTSVWAVGGGTRWAP